MTLSRVVAVAARIGVPVGSRAASSTILRCSGRKSSPPHSQMQWALSMTRVIMLLVNDILFRTFLWNHELSGISGPTRLTR